MPMAVYTFIEKHDWQGKTVIPLRPSFPSAPMRGVDYPVQKGN